MNMQVKTHFRNSRYCRFYVLTTQNLSVHIYRQVAKHSRKLLTMQYSRKFLDECLHLSETTQNSFRTARLLNEACTANAF